MAAFIVACGTVDPSGAGRSAAATAVAPASVAPSGRAASGGGSVAPDSSGPTPQPTRWPADAVHGMTALGGGDNEIAKAVADFSEAVAAEDLARMRAAAIGLENLVTGLGASVERIGAYPPMAPLAAGYRAAFAPMVEGSKQLVAAIDAGDATAIVTATQRITEGMQAYGGVRSQLADWVDELPDQQRMLVE